MTNANEKRGFVMGTVTIKDIARECGVGVSTVSRAMNNHPGTLILLQGKNKRSHGEI